MIKTKKLAAVLLALALVVSLAACGGGEKAAPSTASPGASAGGDQPALGAAGSDGVVEMQTSKETPVVEIGSFGGVLEGPVYVTSVGQSADASMLDAMLKKLGADYAFNARYTAEEMQDAKTILISCGASSKGLGAAGISVEDEKARAQTILDLAAEKNITVVFIHIGGAGRRGATSDEFTDLVLPAAKVMLVVEEGNEDGKFTNFAAQNGIPLILVNSIADAVAPLATLLEK